MSPGPLLAFSTRQGAGLRSQQLREAALRGSQVHLILCLFCCPVNADCDNRSYYLLLQDMYSKGLQQFTTTSIWKIYDCHAQTRIAIKPRFVNH